MDDSMDDSYASLPGYHRPSSRQPIGLGIDPSLPTSALPDPADIYHSHAEHHHAHHDAYGSPGPDASFASSAPGGPVGRHEDEDEEDEGDGEEGDEEEDGASDTSSAMYDPVTDPEGCARRLDELAGVLEVGEEEARALRQGPIIGKGRKAPILPLADFKNYLNHYLTSTEWKYAPPAHAESLLRRQDIPEVYQPGEDLGQLHPIRALGRSWVGREVAGEGEEMMAGLGISEGLPRMHEERRVVEGLTRRSAVRSSDWSQAWTRGILGAGSTPPPSA